MTRRRVAGALLAALLLAAVVASAAWLAGRQTPAADAAQQAGAFAAAVDEGDRARFETLFGRDADPRRVEMLWANLRQVELADVEPGPARSWRIGWRVPGELGLATHLVAPQWRCGVTGCRLTDIVQHLGAPAPIWLTGPISVHRAEQVAVIGGPDAESWLSWSQRAAAQVGGPAPAGLIRAAPLQVVEVPQDEHAFEQVIAAPAIDFRGTGAITWVADSGRAGDSAAPSATRIVINPGATAGLSDQSRFLLLLHEQAHAATAWLRPAAIGRRWVSEGFAEWLMLQHSADEQERSAAVLAASCPVPTTPPADDDFADPAAQPVAYAWSAAAIDQVITAAPDPRAAIVELWQGADTQQLIAPVVDSCG